jgi:S1-C subfamily serine protease
MASAPGAHAADGTGGAGGVDRDAGRNGAAADESAVTGGEASYGRPDGVRGGFDPVVERMPAYTAPPPTVSPADRAAFERPPGADEAGFAPPPADRLPPRHVNPALPVPPGSVETFGRTRTASAQGFDPAPGTRIDGAARRAESPWWKADARRDPWRDPRSPSWLGRPAIFAAGRLAQLDPDVDVEQDEELPLSNESDVDADSGDKSSASFRRGRGRFGLSGFLLALVVALVAGTIGGGAGYWLAGRAHDSLHNSDVKLAKTATAANRPPGSVADIARRVEPAVVAIAVHTSTVDGIGSGVVIDKGGYILTNNHVVSAAATNNGTLVVTFSTQQTAAAKIVGRDPATDLAVIKVDTTSLTVASLGDSSQLAVGDPVVAIGSPLGLLGTVTSGIVSALDRPVHVSGDSSDTNAVIDAIQTDAAINPGNSGGPLVDAQGAVIGINSAIAALPTTSGSQNGSIGLGFAIPINSARSIAEQLIKTGKAVHATIGLNTRSVTTGSRQGAYIAQVVPGGPADQAGLKAGDVVTVADGSLVTSGDELSVVVARHQPGDTISLRYYRGDNEVDTSVKLGSA